MCVDKGGGGGGGSVNSTFRFYIYAPNYEKWESKIRKKGGGLNSTILRK